MRNWIVRYIPQFIEYTKEDIEKVYFIDVIDLMKIDFVNCHSFDKNFVGLRLADDLLVALIDDGYSCKAIGIIGNPSELGISKLNLKYYVEDSDKNRYTVTTDNVKSVNGTMVRLLNDDIVKLIPSGARFIG